MPEREKKTPDVRLIIGTNIRRYRKELGWSQEKLAAEIGVSSEFISRVENGVQYPSIRLLEKVAEHTCHRLNEFFL